MTRLCAWCENPISARARRDAVCCSVRCRQARHRFLRAVGYAEAVAPGRPLGLAYADPPYPGKAHLYRDHPDYGGEVDYAALLARLAEYDGWALSTSAEALPAVCRWIFTLLGAEPGDTLDDLFPGSGAVSRAWAAYTGCELSSAATVDASCKAWADASTSAASDGFDPSCEALDDGCLFSLEAAR